VTDGETGLRRTILKLRQLRQYNERKIMKLRLTALLVAGFVAGTVPSTAQTFSIKDLGAVAGDSVSKGYSLNDLGQAAGSSSNPSGAIPTLFSGGKAINLGTLVAGDVAVATGINESAEVVGYEFEYSNGGDGLSHGVLYSNGALLDLHSPSLFPSGTSATAINGSGVVVGHGQLDYYSFHVFLYSNGQMVDLAPPGSFQASPAAINDAGQIVGNYYTSSTDKGAFLYSNGKFTNLGASAGTSTSAAAINSTGQIAGTISFNSGAPAHAALYSNGVWTDLGGFTGRVRDWRGGHQQRRTGNRHCRFSCKELSSLHPGQEYCLHRPKWRPGGSQYANPLKFRVHPYCCDRDK
jgi:probable HAF family extracellular repeat protein